MGPADGSDRVVDGFQQRVPEHAASLGADRQSPQPVPRLPEADDAHEEPHGRRIAPTAEQYLCEDAEVDRRVVAGHVGPAHGIGRAAEMSDRVLSERRVGRSEVLKAPRPRLGAVEAARADGPREDGVRADDDAPGRRAE